MAKTKSITSGMTETKSVTSGDGKDQVLHPGMTAKSVTSGEEKRDFVIVFCETHLTA